jgi:hypothetical protein
MESADRYRMAGRVDAALRAVACSPEQVRLQTAFLNETLLDG